MSVDDVWDRAEKRQEKYEAALHARIAELKAENEHLLTRITQLREYRDQMLELTHRVEKYRGMLELAYADYEARWNPDWGSFRQHDAWLSDMEADNA